MSNSTALDWSKFDSTCYHHFDNQIRESVNYYGIDALSFHEVEQWIWVVEIILFFFSLTAVALHSQEAGGRISRVAIFHIAHACFALWFVIVDTIEFQSRASGIFSDDFYQNSTASYSKGQREFRLSICKVDTAVYYILRTFFYVVMWCPFANYWESVISSSTKYLSWLRTVVWTLAWLGGMLVEGARRTRGNGHYYLEPIDAHNGHQNVDDGETPSYGPCLTFFAEVCPGVVGVEIYERFFQWGPVFMLFDSARFSVLCFLRVKKAYGDVRNAFRQSSGMALLTVIFFVVWVLALIKDKQSDRVHVPFQVIEILTFTIPGFVMLMMTWKRNYIGLALGVGLDPSVFDNDFSGDLESPGAPTVRGHLTQMPTGKPELQMPVTTRNVLHEGHSEEIRETHQRVTNPKEADNSEKHSWLPPSELSREEGADADGSLPSFAGRTSLTTDFFRESGSSSVPNSSSIAADSSKENDDAATNDAKSAPVEGFTLSASLDIPFPSNGSANRRRTSSLLQQQEQQQQPPLHIEERLEPFPATVTVARLYLDSVALPVAERAAAKYKSGTLRLLEAASSSISSDDRRLGDIDKHKQFESLKSECEHATGEAEDWLQVLTDLSRDLRLLENSGEQTAARTGGHLFKTSAQKKVKSLMFLGTNLHTHTSKIAVSATAGVGVAETATDNVDVTTITYGAPSAHALKFKDGGLRQMEAKLAAGKEKLSKLTLDGSLKLLKLQFALSQREAICVAQALSSAVAASVDTVASAVRSRDARHVRQLAAIGLLLHEVCLLSTHGHEENMLDDMAGALERLDLTVELVQSTAPAAGSDVSFVGVGPTGGVLGSSGKLTVVLGVNTSSEYEWLTAAMSTGASSSVGPLRFQVKPILFNLGVNEMQTIANAKRSTGMQTEINRRGVLQMREYGDELGRFMQRDAAGYGDAHSARGEVRIAAKEMKVRLDELERVVELEAFERGKHVEVLMVGALLARDMGGARTTSCKSAKDRTSMFVTLEHAKCAIVGGLLKGPIGRKKRSQSAWVDDRATEGEELVEQGSVQKVLDELRSIRGVRLRNCEANIGVPKYAFNLVQMKAFPPELRAPAGTAGGTKLT
jgi:hypothetical protein